jgi:Transposase.
LREADVRLSQGRTVGQACREMGIAEQTYYRWREEYGGMKTVQVKRLNDLTAVSGKRWRNSPWTSRF